MPVESAPQNEPPKWHEGEPVPPGWTPVNPGNGKPWAGGGLKPVIDHPPEKFPWGGRKEGDDLGATDWRIGHIGSEHMLIYTACTLATITLILVAMRLRMSRVSRS